MRRDSTGRYEASRVGGETVRAFVPYPLPPEPEIVLDGALGTMLERAVLALGRLDSLATFLPEPKLFLYTYVRKEAVLSSQIEGTQSSLSDLLLFELDEAPGVPVDDAVEVSGYVAALEHGLMRLRGGFPVSNRLFREMHAKLLTRGRGSDTLAGEFRRSQNWIGGTRPGNAHFVPPPAHAVETCMGQLETFIHDQHRALPLLVKAALAHVQLETIHPFLDGNGRLGRLLITLLICDAGMLAEPILYLSLFFKQHRTEYYQLLDNVRTDGDWEGWLEFFLEGVRTTASGAVAMAKGLVEIVKSDAARIRTGGRASASALRVHAALSERPVTSLSETCRRTGLSFPAATAGMDVLLKFGVAREITGRRRNRIFTYERYLALLSEGT